MSKIITDLLLKNLEKHSNLWLSNQANLKHYLFQATVTNKPINQQEKTQGGVQFPGVPQGKSTCRSLSQDSSTSPSYEFCGCPLGLLHHR